MFTHIFSKGRIGTLELKNRVVMSPMGNYLANPDGSVSDADVAFYTARAEGGVGLIFTECMIVDYRRGKGNTHQIAVADDRFIPGLKRLADSIHAHDARIIGQIYHPGRQGVSAINENLPMLAPSATECGVVHQPTAAMTTAEVEDMVVKFADAALRLKQAGFDGVEVHGAHGYLVNEFLSPYTNRRDDRYGGSFDNRCRVLFEVIDGIRAATAPQFQLGLRLSPERFDIRIGEALELARLVMADGRLDWLDMSLWDCFKPPQDAAYAGRPLIDHFAALPRGHTRLGVAGKIMDAATAQHCLDAGADFVLIGRGAMLHHDFARRALADARFRSIERPVSRAHLEAEGLGPAFVHYVASTWPRFVADA